MHQRKTATGILLVLIAAIVAIATAANAGSRNGLARRNDAAPVELEQLHYLVGQWKVTTYVRNDAGEFEPVAPTSFMETRYLFDGYGVLTEYHSNDPDDFYSISIVTWDDELGRFVISFHNAKKNRRVRFEGRMKDGALLVTNRGGYGEKGDFVFRESDVEITKTSFVKRLHRSDDDGRTWIELDYYFTYERLSGGVARADRHRRSSPGVNIVVQPWLTYSFVTGQGG